MLESHLHPGAERPGAGQHLNSSSTLSSTTSSSSFISNASTIPSSAPTPYNTVIPENEIDIFSDASASTSRLPRIYASSDNDGLHIQPSIGGESTSPSRPTDSSRHQSSFSSYAGSSHHLLPYSPPIRDPQIQSFVIPDSTRPVPEPPQSLRMGSSGISNDRDMQMEMEMLDDFDAEADKSTTSINPLPSLYRQPTSSTSAPSTPSTPSFSLKSRLLRRKKGAPPVQDVNQDDRDALRLQQLGYDAVLGRDYTFWSSLAISWLNIGCIQGTVYAVSGAYNYGGPLMIVSFRLLSEEFWLIR